MYNKFLRLMQRLFFYLQDIHSAKVREHKAYNGLVGAYGRYTRVHIHIVVERKAVSYTHLPCITSATERAMFGTAGTAVFNGSLPYTIKTTKRRQR